MPVSRFLNASWLQFPKIDKPWSKDINSHEVLNKPLVEFLVCRI